jgi:hypothetical protein
MNTQTLINRLLELPKQISQREESVLKIASDARAKQAALEIKEWGLLLAVDGPINGKNAEQRAAQLQRETYCERCEVEAQKSVKADYERQVRELQNEFAALRTIAKLIARETE